MQESIGKFLQTLTNILYFWISLGAVHKLRKAERGEGGSRNPYISLWGGEGHSSLVDKSAQSPKGKEMSRTIWFKILFGMDI